jgi:hypothetical protein
MSRPSHGAFWMRIIDRDHDEGEDHHAAREQVLIYSKMAIDMTRVRLEILLPIIRTTPKLPTMFENPNMPPDRKPNRSLHALDIYMITGPTTEPANSQIRAMIVLEAGGRFRMEEHDLLGPGRHEVHIHGPIARLREPYRNQIRTYSWWSRRGSASEESDQRLELCVELGRPSSPSPIVSAAPI